MSSNNLEQPKKSSSVLEKLGQRFNTIKDDIADNFERIKQSHSSTVTNQVHFINRTASASDDSLIIEKRAPSPTTETSRRLPSTSDENSPSNSINRRTNIETSSSTSDLATSCSYHDLFSCENSEQARDMIFNDVRHDQTPSKTMSITQVATNPKDIPNKLIAGPRFIAQISDQTHSFARNTIYPVSVAVGLVSFLLTIWKPISPFISGFIVGFLFAASIAYVVIRFYLNCKNIEQSNCEWIDLSSLETTIQEKVVKHERQTSLQSCGEVIFGCYDADKDEQFIRYPAVIRLDNYRLIIQLLTKGKTDDKKEIKFIGYREYLIKESNLTLVPEITLTRVKYWLNEYPIVLQNLQILDKQIINKQSYDKSKIDIDEFFNNHQTTLSLFFETGPEKEEWFLQLSLALRKGKDDIERSNRLLQNSTTFSESSPSLISVESAPACLFSPVRTTSVQSNSTNNSDRISVKSADFLDTLSESADTISIKSRSEPNEKDKENQKKKNRKNEENRLNFLDSSSSIDDAALTLNFLFRRLFCDVSQEKLFSEWLKVKIELKLKEIALSVLEGLRVEKIEMGNTLPLFLRVESMQWNSKGLWFKLFIFYRGSFKTTIKTRIFLQRLLNNSATSDSTLNVHFVNRDDDHYDEEELLLRNRSTPVREVETTESIAAKRIGNLLTKVASNKHVQRLAALKPVAGALERLSNAEVGVNIELLNISGLMKINIPPPPSDRIWIGFSEMPDLNLKVTPVVGDSQYSYTLIHDFLEARIRDEIRRLLVFPSMDDQLLPFMHDWVSDVLQENERNSQQK